MVCSDNTWRLVSSYHGIFQFESELIFQFFDTSSKNEIDC